MLPLILMSIFAYATVLNAAIITSLGGLAANITGTDQVFDFVIVGAGTAGITLAFRLTEDSTVTVALIEAGSFYETDNAPLSSTPFGDIFGVGTSSSEIDPNPLTGANNRVLHYARERHWVAHQRPSKDSLQMWAEEVGDQSYTWDNWLPYFKKSVTFTPPNTEIRAANATADYNASAFESNGGPLTVSYPNYAQPFSSYMPDGFTEIGVPPTTDFNSGLLMGAQYAPATIDPSGAFRASSQETFLTAATNRTNLKVFDLTMAKKVLFDSQKIAIGVQVNTSGSVFNVNATKEVILSAGAFQSPQLLMVSGVGPKSTLETLGIDVIVDNANVGQNLWDHVLAGIDFPIITDGVTRLVNDVQYRTDSLLEWQSNGTGPFSNNNVDFLAWEKVPNDVRQSFSASVLKELEYFPADWPELEYLVAPAFIGNWSAPDVSQPTSGSFGSVAAGVVAPLSRGNVTITSADTNDLPLINPNWLDHPSDIAVILAGYKRVRQLFATSSVERVLNGSESFPGAQYTTDDELLDQIRGSCMTIWHASATCKMGSPNDTFAVVNPHAQVIGVQHLRVVDASSFALLPPGHPQSVVCQFAIIKPNGLFNIDIESPLPLDALAEKIADDIKWKWSLQL
ncbi:hypothetical protein BDP27DRAFT_1385798 [Rhodocollybia butyracea]|uniref:Glucose-methanol-choline oxidoreductase N-terminal domain-containing protein n=1 Tax=Rhodocollybia butyracea TaxID=206335 RepID=A0A9P5P5W1_9AGAR|nr:hypothetical protein BDP27DRAFT_1385798 [Rhodocollybia butyracea]